MATGIEKGLETIKKYCDDDTHGYVLKSGNHDSYTTGTDCAGLVRMYCAAVEDEDLSSYDDFGTWSEEDTLTLRGWTSTAFDYSSAKRGDVFLRALGDASGHTVVYLGDGLIAGAESDLDGKSGDSSGREVIYGKDYYAYKYNYILRPRDEWEPVTTQLIGGELVDEEDDMECIISVPKSGKMTCGVQVYYCNGEIHDLANTNNRDVLKTLYKTLHGKTMPTVEMSADDFAMLVADVRGGIPQTSFFPQTDTVTGRSTGRASGNKGTE